LAGIGTYAIAKIIQPIATLALYNSAMRMVGNPGNMMNAATFGTESRQITKKRIEHLKSMPI
jgi:hypothetical protein